MADSSPVLEKANSEPESTELGSEPVETTPTPAAPDASAADADAAGTDKSSYYFFKSTSAEEFAKYKPKPLGADGQLPQDSSPKPIAAEPSGAAAGASTWNTGGAGWEEKNLTKWARTTLDGLLEGLELSPGFVVRKISTLDGDAYAYFVRGKKKFGFDLQLKFVWAGQIVPPDAEGESKKVKGKIECANFCSDDEPHEWKIKVSSKKTDAAHESAKELLRAKTVRSVVVETLQKFLVELERQ